MGNICKQTIISEEQLEQVIMIRYKEPCVLCLGFFDGVHLGHQALVSTGRAIADKENLKVFVHTYEVPPFEVITGQKAELLTGNREKELLLKHYGADVVVYSPFDREVMKMPGKVYFEDVLLQLFDPRVIVAGQDHRFGHGGETDAKALNALCGSHGIRLVLIPPVLDDNGKRISASEIRKNIKNGDIHEAERKLGHQYKEQGREDL